MCVAGAAVSSRGGRGKLSRGINEKERTCGFLVTTSFCFLTLSSPLHITLSCYLPSASLWPSSSVNGGSCSLPWAGWTSRTTAQQNMLTILIYWLHRDRKSNTCPLLHCGAPDVAQLYQRLSVHVLTHWNWINTYCCEERWSANGLSRLTDRTQLSTGRRTSSLLSFVSFFVFTDWFRGERAACIWEDTEEKVIEG